MSKVRGGLGRGLGALIPSTPPPPPAAPVGTEVSVPATRDGGIPAAAERWDLAPVPGVRFADIPVGGIVPNPKQPRTVFDDESLEQLKASIEEVGFLQPIVVREAGPQRYEIVMGERRWRAAQSLGRELIPAIIRDTRDDAMLRDALVENIHRADLHPLEEAAAYQQLLDEFGATHEELARRIGRSRPQISNTIRLLNLPSVVQRRVAAGTALRCRVPSPASRPGTRHRSAVPSRMPPLSPTSPSAFPTGSTPGSRWISAAARARSPSSSPPWTTSNGSSASSGWKRNDRSNRRLSPRTTRGHPDSRVASAIQLGTIHRSYPQVPAVSRETACERGSPPVDDGWETARRDRLQDARAQRRGDVGCAFQGVRGDPGG